MKMIRQVEVLCRQHDDVRQAAACYAKQIASAQLDAIGLAKCRWTLTRLVTSHLAYADAHLYPALPGCGERATALGDRMSADHGDLYRRIQNHVRKWPMGVIAGDWAGYRVASGHLLAELLIRMDREEKELYPLLVVAKAA